MALTQHTVTRFIEQVKNEAKWYLSHSDFIQLLQELEDYLLDKTTVIPNIHKNHYDWYFKRELFSLLSAPGHWGEDEQRIFSLWKKKTWYNDGRFWEWVIAQVREEQERDTVFYLAQDLQKNYNSLSEAAVFQLIVSRLFLHFYQTDSRQLSSAGRFVLTLLPVYQEKYIKIAAGNDRTEMITFLLDQNHEDLVWQHVEILLKNYQKDIRTDVVALLLNYNAVKYEPVIENVLAKGRGLENKWNVMRIVVGHFPEKYHPGYVMSAFRPLSISNIILGIGIALLGSIAI